MNFDLSIITLWLKERIKNRIEQNRIEQTKIEHNRITYLEILWNAGMATSAPFAQSALLMNSFHKERISSSSLVHFFYYVLLRAIFGRNLPMKKHQICWPWLMLIHLNFVGMAAHILPSSTIEQMPLYLWFYFYYSQLRKRCIYSSLPA